MGSIPLSWPYQQTNPISLLLVQPFWIFMTLARTILIGSLTVKSLNGAWWSIGFIGVTGVCHRNYLVADVFHTLFLFFNRCCFPAPLPSPQCISPLQQLEIGVVHGGHMSDRWALHTSPFSVVRWTEWCGEAFSFFNDTFQKGYIREYMTAKNLASHSLWTIHYLCILWYKSRMTLLIIL